MRVPRGWQPLRVLAFSRETARQTRRRRLDVVYSLARTATQNVYRAGAGCHADYLCMRYSRLACALRRASPRHAALLALERRIFGDPRQLLVCNSRRVRGQIAARYAIPESRFAVIYNGVDSERFRPRPDERSRLRAEIDASVASDTPVWVFAANDYARKGLDTALLALARARRGSPNLWVAGGREGRASDLAESRRVRELGLGDRVRFLGPRKDLPQVLAAADGLLLPTRYDAFANVCLEAAACGLPVLTSTANGAAELFDGIGPAPVDARDTSGFAAGLDALAAREARARVGAQMRAVAVCFGWTRHVRELRDVLLGEVEQRRANSVDVSGRS